MSNGERSRGAALVIAIMILLLAGVTAMALGELGRLAMTRARLDRDGARAWFLAEAGLADTVAALPAGTSYTASLARGTSRVDAGDRWGYATTFLDDHDETPDDPAIDRNARVRLRVVATGPAPVRRRLEALLGRASLPFWPAAVVLTGGVNELTQAFTVDGRDYVMSDACESTGPGRERFALALPSGARRPLAQIGQLLGHGSDPSMIALEDLSLESLAHAAGATHRARGALAGAFGTSALPAFSIVDGDATVDGSVTGAGVLFIDGRLEITGRIDFTGVLAARAGVTVGDVGTLFVCGGLWAGSDPALAVRGHGRVRGSDEALLTAMRVVPLPAAPRVVAVRELF